MSKKSARKAYESITPSLLVPDHFICNQESTMVAIYDEPLGDEIASITLVFPGDHSGSSPQYVFTRRVENQTLVFDTPVYNTSRGQVEVLPVLKLVNGETQHLGKFMVTVKHPLTTVMELCIKLSSSNAVLPVLTTLMLNVDKKGTTDHFKDSHTDRMMTLLVGSMKPGTSCTIGDIMLPDKKWKKKNLADLARKFGLRNMEKESFMVTAQRKRPVIKRSDTVFKHDSKARAAVSGASPDHENGLITGSHSSPSINTLGLDEGEDEEPECFTEEVVMSNQLENDKKRAAVVIQQFVTRDPDKLSLKVGQKVYIITNGERGWWYGACNGKHGYFPARCVKSSQETPTIVRKLPPLPNREPIPIPSTDKTSRVSPSDDQASRIHRNPPNLIHEMTPKLQNVLKQKPTRLAQPVTYKKSTSEDENDLSPQRRFQHHHSTSYEAQDSIHSSSEYVDMVAPTFDTDDESEDECPTSPSGGDKHWTDSNFLQGWKQMSKEQSTQSRSPEKTFLQVQLRPTQQQQQPTKTSPTTRPVVPLMPPNGKEQRRGPESPLVSKSIETSNLTVPPQPPVRTTSKGKNPVPSVQATYRLETEQIDTSGDEDDEEDKNDYINLNEEGLPFTRQQIEKKFSYVNYNPLLYEVVQGHMYERPQDDNWLVHEASEDPLSSTSAPNIQNRYTHMHSPEAVSSTHFHPRAQDAYTHDVHSKRAHSMHQEFGSVQSQFEPSELRTHGAKRKTHEVVTIAPDTARTKVLPPTPPCKPPSTSTASQHPVQTAASAGGSVVRRLKQQLETKVSYGTERKY